MLLIEALMALLVFLTLSVVTAMVTTGLVSVLGPIRLVKCPSCHHLARTVPPSATACLHCHYRHMLHTLHLARGTGHGVTV